MPERHTKQGAPLHTDYQPILGFSDMDLYMMVDVAPSLKRLLAYQQEDLSRYFAGTPGQRVALTTHLGMYTAYHRDYIENYERSLGHAAQ